MNKITLSEALLLQKYFNRISESVNVLIYDFDTRNGDSIKDTTIRRAYIYWRTKDFLGKKYYVILGYLFDELLENNLINRANKEFEDNNPESVLEALWKNSDLYFERNDLLEFLRKESYIAITDEKCENVLIIPLFRAIGLDKEGIKEFKNGLLHMYQHFSLNGNSISASSEKMELPPDLIWEIVNCFFTETPKVKSNSINHIVVKSKNLNYNFNEIFEYELKIQEKKFKMIVFHNKNFNVSFLSTLFRIS